jgi:cytoskeletal protein CcmA (bactofilin family)
MSVPVVSSSSVRGSGLSAARQMTSGSSNVNISSSKGAPGSMIIGEEVKIKGNVKFDSHLTVNGYVDGKLLSPVGASIQIGTKGILVGHAKGLNLVENEGKIVGDISAITVILRRNSSTFGNVHCQHFYMEENAVFVGSLNADKDFNFIELERQQKEEELRNLEKQKQQKKDEETRLSNLRKSESEKLIALKNSEENAKENESKLVELKSPANLNIDLISGSIGVDDVKVMSARPKGVDDFDEGINNESDLNIISNPNLSPNPNSNSDINPNSNPSLTPNPQAELEVPNANTDTDSQQLSAPNEAKSNSEANQSQVLIVMYPQHEYIAGNKAFVREGGINTNDCIKNVCSLLSNHGKSIKKIYVFSDCHQESDASFKSFWSSSAPNSEEIVTGKKILYDDIEKLTYISENKDIQENLLADCKEAKTLAPSYSLLIENPYCLPTSQDIEISGELKESIQLWASNSEGVGEVTYFNCGLIDASNSSISDFNLILNNSSNPFHRVPLFQKTVDHKNDKKSELLSEINNSNRVLLSGTCRDTAIFGLVQSFSDILGGDAVKGLDGKKFVLLSNCKFKISF